MKNKRLIKVRSTGAYLASDLITSESLDKKLNKPKGWVERKTGIVTRRYERKLRASEMGGKAAQEAMINADLGLEDIDCIVATCGTMDQHIPCNAVMIKRALGAEKYTIPCFDINATCLSFLYGLDTLSDSIELGKYKRILLVAADLCHRHMNWKQLESCLLFGDGAAAVILEKTNSNDQSCLLGAHFENYVEGALYTEVAGAGTTHAVSQYNDLDTIHQLAKFNMNGKKIFKLAAKLIVPFINRLYKKAGISNEDITLTIPHQASGHALAYGRKKWKFEKDRYFVILNEFGNQVSVSIPMGLHLAVQRNRIKRGDIVCLVGTGAGLTLGGVVLKY